MIDEEDEWDIVSFTDPRDSSVYDIIDDRVIIAFKNPPELPEVDADYFEDALPSNDTYYTSVTYSAPSTDQDIADFIDDENLTVYAEWPEVGGMAALLPSGQTVSDAVANWPTEYSDIIEVVDADIVVDADSLSAPDDYLYNLELSPGAPNDDLITWHTNPNANGQHINVNDVWDYYETHGVALVNSAVAILDSGVQYANDDLQSLSTIKGCNTGDDMGSTTFLSRASSGGDPWDFLLDRNEDYARALGHGTTVCGVVSAEIDNDGGSSISEKSTSGIVFNAHYFPIAIKAKGDYAWRCRFSESAIINAYSALGAVHGRYDKSALYSAQLAATVPHYWIRVANCSYGKENSTAVSKRHLDALSPYILFVGSAGNDGTNSYTGFPASHPNAIGVAAYSKSGARWSSSNYETAVDIAAPGDSIVTCDMVGTNSSSDDLGYSTGSWLSTSGTSLAAPCVSACALLVFTRNPTWSPSQVRSRILSTKVNLPSGDLQYVGKPDVYAAMGL